MVSNQCLKYVDLFLFKHCTEEIKICGTPQDDCSEYATCADTGPGTYTCTCNKGYTGDGKICEGDKIEKTFTHSHYILKYILRFDSIIQHSLFTNVHIRLHSVPIYNSKCNSHVNYM